MKTYDEEATEPLHMIAVLDDGSNHEALYLDGKLVEQDSTIYACDIARHAGDRVIQFSQIVVTLPVDQARFPDDFAQCMLWVKE